MWSVVSVELTRTTWDSVRDNPIAVHAETLTKSFDEGATLADVRAYVAELARGSDAHVTRGRSEYGRHRQVGLSCNRGAGLGGHAIGEPDQGGRVGAPVRAWRGQAARPGDQPALPRLQDRADVPPGPSLGAMLGQVARRRAVPAPGADGRGAVGPRLLEGAYRSVIVDEVQDPVGCASPV